MSMRSNNAIIKKCVVQRFGVRTPELTQFVPKLSQNGPKMAPKLPQDGPEDAPRRPQDGTKVHMLLQSLPGIVFKWSS